MDVRPQILRKHRVALFSSILVLAVVGIVCYLALPRPDLLARKLRQRGYPATLAELEAWYPAVPSAENAALMFTNAFAHLVNFSNYLAGAWLPAIGQGFSEQEKAALASVFEANRAALDLLYSVWAAMVRTTAAWPGIRIVLNPPRTLPSL